jgi:hypothetical protein
MKKTKKQPVNVQPSPRRTERRVAQIKTAVHPARLTPKASRDLAALAKAGRV